MKYIPYGKQQIDDKDVMSVGKILKSDWLTQGPTIEKFERALARYCNVKYAVAVSSGTAALHLACLAAGLKNGDEAITTPITFVATANSIIYAGAKPVFADIELETFNVDPKQIKRKITQKTKAILPVHFAGLPCNMREIYNLVKGRGITIIEDACHALGAEYRYNGSWIKVGSCKHSDMTVFSFHPVKHITTGEGGAITTNRRKLYEKLQALKAHGIYKNSGMNKKYGPWYYEMRTLGFNYRITDFQCALGLSQLKKIKEFLKKRRAIAQFYKNSFSKYKGIKIQKINNCRHAYHLFVLLIDFNESKATRKELVAKLSKLGIKTQVHYIPIYKLPYYKNNYYVTTVKYPKSEFFYKRAISIPIFSSLKKWQVKKIINSINLITNFKRRVDGEEINIMKTTEPDCKYIWKWRSDKKIRNWCLNSEKIPFQKHKAWFLSKLKNRKTNFYIVKNKREERIGCVRFEINKDNSKSAEININLNPSFIGKGYGKEIIKKSTRIFFRDNPKINEIYAKILIKNIASKKVFSTVGYKFLKISSEGNIPVRIYIQKRND